MMGFCAQLLNARQCVGLNMLQETVKAEDNFVSSYVRFHVGDRVSVRGVWAFLPPETLHTGTALTGSQISLFSSADLFVLSGFPTVLIEQSASPSSILLSEMQIW